MKLSNVYYESFGLKNLLARLFINIFCYELEYVILLWPVLGRMSQIEYQTLNINQLSKLSNCVLA